MTIRGNAYDSLVLRVDLTGRRVCPDSFYTKSAGCNSAEDRVVVENNLRPQYAEFFIVLEAMILFKIGSCLKGWRNAFQD